MKRTKSFMMKSICLASITLVLAITSCINFARDNTADKWGDTYNSVYSDKTISSFSFKAPAVDGIINETESSIVVYVPYGTDVTSLIAKFSTKAPLVTVDGNIQMSTVTGNDFTDPVTYNIQADDGTSRDYTVSVVFAALSSFKLKLLYSMASGVIDQVNSTIKVTVPYCSTVTHLVAYFEAAGTVTVNGVVQTSGTTPNDFTMPVSYTVTDPNGVSQVYTVTLDYHPLSVSHLSGPLGGPGREDGTGAGARFNNPQGITTDGVNLYVTNTASNTIRKIVIATGEVTTLAGYFYNKKIFADSTCHNDTGTSARFYNPHGITTDGVNLYVADTSNHTIRQIVITTGVVTSLAGSGDSTIHGHINGTGSAARFFKPHGITTDGTFLYVADTFNNNIRKIEISTGIVTTFAGSITGDSGYTNLTGTAARFNSPQGITTDGVNLYVADTGNNVIRMIKISDQNVSTVAGSLTTVVTGFQDDIANDSGILAQFNSPQGIITDGNYLYVADTGNNAIRQIVILSLKPSEHIGDVSTLSYKPASGAPLEGIVDGICSNALFSAPADIISDGANLYIGDAGNNVIRKISQPMPVMRMVTTLAGLAGSFGSAEDTLNDHGATARFHNPEGVTSDGTNLYVTDYKNNTIRQIVIATGNTTTIAGTGDAGNVDDPTPSGTSIAQFHNPYGIAVVSSTTSTILYVSDSYNNNIRMIDLSTNPATVITIAGSLTGANGYNTIPATGTAALFDCPKGITTDGTNLYVIDSNNYAVRQIAIETKEVTTLAGTGVQGAGTTADDLSALFYSPEGITIDDTGTYLFVTDGNAVRQIEIETKAVTTIAGIANTAGSNDGIYTAATFSSPRGITKRLNSLYVTDSGNNTIRKVVILTGDVVTLVGTVDLSGSQDGTGSDANFNNPGGIIYVGPSQNTKFYVADTGNNAIRVLYP